MNYEEAKNFIYNEIDSDNALTIHLLLSEDKISEGLTLIKKLTSCDDIIAKALWTDIKTDFGSPENNVFFKIK